MQNLMPVVNTSDGVFHDGDPTTGELGTVVPSLHLNNTQSAIRDVQSELIGILSAAAISPSTEANTQLLTALQNLFLQPKNNLSEIAKGGEGSQSAAFSNLGLGEAAKRGVGAGKNQLPDMSSFSGLNDVTGWKALPGGLIIQWGSTTTGASSPVTAYFSIPFPSTAFVVVGCIYDDVNPENTTLRRKTSPEPRACAQFFVNNGTAATSTNWIAIGM